MNYHICSGAYTFEYDGIHFLIVDTDECYEVFAEMQYQFGISPDQVEDLETINDIIDLVIANYDNGNIYIEE